MKADNNKGKLDSANLAALLKKDGDEEFTRSEMDRLILEAVGLSISDSVMEAIFSECDVDKSGKVSIKELSDFINNIRERTEAERVQYVVSNLFWSATVWGSLMYFVGAVTAVALNVRPRVRDNIGEDPINYAGMNGILYTLGSYAFVSVYRDAKKIQLDLVETAKKKIVSFVRRLDGSTSVDAEKEMTPREFFQLLEDDGVYLPYPAFSTIFTQIDDDNSGYLTFNEVKAYAYAKEKRGELSYLEYEFKLWKVCARSIAYWMLWSWMIGSILFAIAPYCKECSPNAIKQLYGWGSILYAAGAICLWYLQYEDAANILNYQQEMNGIFLGFVAEELGATVETATEEESRAACHKVFERFDVGAGSGSDGNLDFIELYDALTQTGFVIQQSILRSIFDAADVSGDGQLQLDEFIDYVLGIKTGKTEFEKQMDILKYMGMTVGFYMVLMSVTGGFLFIAGSYVDDAKAASNLYLAGTIGFLVPLTRFLYTLVSGHSDYFGALALGKINFKKAIIAKIIPARPEEAFTPEDEISL